MHFSYKDGCGGHGCCTRIDVFKEELTWATDKQPHVISNIMLFNSTFKFI